MENERRAYILERHFIKDILKYKNNNLIMEILKIKFIESEKTNKRVNLFFTIRDNYIGIYMNGMVVNLELKNNIVYLTPTNSNSKNDNVSFVAVEPLEIGSVLMYKKEMSKIFDVYTDYQDKHQMNEKIFQHVLTDKINEIKTLKEYENITIIDAELYIYLTEFKKRGNPRGKLDLVGVTDKGKLLFIEVKIDGSVILGDNGINKHCYDIREYCNPLHMYRKQDINNWIEQMNLIFNKEIKYIKSEVPDFIIICGYHNSEKYDVVDQLSEIISSSMVNNLKHHPNIVNVMNKPEEVKTINQHFEDLKSVKVNPKLLLVEVDDNYNIISDYDIKHITTKSWSEKSFHEIRTSLLNYIDRHTN